MTQGQGTRRAIARSFLLCVVVFALLQSALADNLQRKHHARRRSHLHSRSHAALLASASTEVHSTTFTERVSGSYTPAPKDAAFCPNKCKGEDSIVKALEACNSTPKCCLDLIYETVGYVNNLFKTNNITYWAMKGSLLGVHRDKGIIEHDYDIDLGTTLDELNKIMALHDKVWDDGYVMFPAPWPGYNNMNVVIAKRTPDVDAWCKENSVTKGVVPEFTKEIRKLMISAEVMVFKSINGRLIQMVCTRHKSGDKWLYDGAVDDNKLKKEAEEDDRSFAGRKGSASKGWLTYAGRADRAFQDFRSKLDADGTSKTCIRSAPSSFRYEADAADVLPVGSGTFYDLAIPTPKNVAKYLSNYFGDDFMTPQRRYGKCPRK